MNDLYLIDDVLKQGEKLLRDTVHKFIDTQALPLFPEAFEHGRFPKELIPGLASLGLFGMSLPEQYGGNPINAVSYGLVCQELERGDSGLRSFVTVQDSLCMSSIYQYGSEEQKQQFLPEMAKGKIIGCFGLTEPDAGSDPASMKTYARKVPGGFRISGTKSWITNAPIADIAIVWSRTQEGISGFIVEKEFKGFERLEIKNKLSLRVSCTGQLVLDDCFVPDKNYLPGTAKGLRAAFNCLAQARYGISWGAMGAAISCYDTAVSYAKERKQFNKPIASFQLIQKDLADMLTEIVKAQCMNLHLGRLKDQNKVSAVMISMAKMNACQQALKIARSARNILAANGISLEYPVMRHMNNLESVFTYEGTDNIHHLIIGKYITGMDAFS